MSRYQVGLYYGPKTRIRRRGIAGHQNIRMRSFLKSSALYLAIFFVFALGYVWTRVKVMEVGYNIRHLEDAQTELKTENHALTVEAATLRSPQRLEVLANQLGLKRPDENQVIFLGPMNVDAKPEIVSQMK